MELNIIKNHSLKHLNTFGVDVKTDFFCEINSLEQFNSLFCDETYIASSKKLILGTGSNILFTDDFKGFIIKMAIKGIRIYNKNAKQTHISVGAGEIWHDFVKFCIENELYGVENLSLIPGTVGAAPIQNIGAYGAELKQVLLGVETIDLKNGNRRFLNRTSLKLGYRDSIFKHEAKDKFAIVAVHFRLNNFPKYNISYGAIKETLDKKGIKELSIKAISDVVVEIRESKLPNPKEIGNAGSFFKNPTISIAQLNELKIQYPAIPNYPVDKNAVKLAAGWLIEQCGWKGKRIGNTGIHVNQALVLVNYGEAKGKEIVNLAFDIISSVEQKFGVKLSPEVNIL